jgi:hypothetical protein
MRILFLSLVGVAAVCVSCSTSRDVTAEPRYNLQGIPKKANLVLKQPCWFIDNPGVDNLVSGEKGKFSDWDQKHKAGIVPANTRIRFLGVRAESGYMVDTHISNYGRIADGEFKGRRVSLDRLIAEQDKTPIYYSTLHE